MFAIAVLGLVTITLGVFMVAKPVAWGQGILRFAHTPYFHATEIGLRLLMGGVLVVFADQTAHPALFSSLGHLMIGVAAFLLLLIGEGRHRRAKGGGSEASCHHRALYLR